MSVIYAFLAFGLVLATSAVVALWWLRQPPPFTSETQRRAWEHNRDRGDLPKMCKRCGAYMENWGSDHDRWHCTVCAEASARRRDDVAAEVKAHNDRIRQAQAEANTP